MVVNIDNAIRTNLDKAGLFTAEGETIDGIKYESTTQGIDDAPEFYQITSDFIVRHITGF